MTVIRRRPIPLHQVRGIVFDLDDTLVSSQAFWTRSVVRTIVRALLVTPGKIRGIVSSLRSFRAARESTRGEGPFPDLRQEVLKRASLRSGIPASVIQEHVYPLIYGDFMGLDRYCAAGVPDAIRALKSRGIKVAVLSDYPTEAKLEAAGLGDLPWDLTMDAEELGALKPASATFEMAAERLGEDLSRLVYVGDRADTDIEGAKAVGMHAVQVKRFMKRVSQEADAVVDSAVELPSVLSD